MASTTARLLREKVASAPKLMSLLPIQTHTHANYYRREQKIARQKQQTYQS